MKYVLSGIMLCFLLGSTAEARPRAWCGWYMAQYYGITGRLNRELWLARNWLKHFQRGPLQPGMVAVFARGKRGGHVGKIVAVHGNSIVLHSGNDGGRVRTRVRSTRGLLGAVYVSHTPWQHPNKTRMRYAPTDAGSHGVPTHHELRMEGLG